MAQIIILAKHYQKRPSEILNIDNDYLAYMFDEVALYLESAATTNKGLNWSRIKWIGEKRTKNTNAEFRKYMEKFT